MDSDSTFGAEPFQLHRLFEIGLDKTELDEETPPSQTGTCLMRSQVTGSVLIF